MRDPYDKCETLAFGFEFLRWSWALDIEEFGIIQCHNKEALLIEYQK